MYKYLYKVTNGERNAYVFEWLHAGDNNKDNLRIWIPETKVFKGYWKGYNNYVKTTN